MTRSLWLGCLLFAVPACGGDDEDPEGARELLSRVRSENYWTEWERAPGYEERRDAASPHSDRVDIYVNDIVADALAAGEPLEAWPEGSIIVKEGFSGGDQELTALMEKQGGSWFWAEFFGDDSKYSGTPEICTDCHESGDDYVLAFPLP